MKYLYILMLIHFAVSEVKCRYNRITISGAIKNAEYSLSKMKDFFETKEFSQNFVQSVWLIINLIGFFIRLVVLGLAMVGFKSIFG